MRRESGFPETSRRGGVVGRQGRNAFRTHGAIWKSTAAATRQSARGVRANITGAPPTLCQVANIRVDTSVLTDEEIAVAILSKLGKLGRNWRPGSPIPATAR